MQEITQHYPDATPIRELEKKITSDLNMNGFILSRTIWGTSICSDEVNNSFNLFGKMFVGPGPFRFGGISGIPFTGKTGFLAFASHIPDKGNAFILYGPHIGISKSGEIGEIHRQKQQINSTCCGSLISGLGTISSDAIVTDPEHDRQQHVVVKMLEAQKAEILSADNSIKKATDVAYTHINQEVKWLLSHATNIPKGTKIYLMGGILINTDWDKEDWFEVRDTELIEF